MIKVSIDGIDKAIARVKQIDKQVRYASMVAINETAKAVQGEIRREMSSSFDRPTPWTLQNVRIRFARRDDLSAEVFFGRDLYSKSKLTPQAILGHQFAGGERQRKSLELYLQSGGFISPGEMVVPGAGARIDQFGNMSRGQVQQVISQLRLGLDPFAWTSMSKRSQASVRRAGRIFWSRGGHLPRGAWVDQGGEIGLRPLLIVISGAKYKRRIDVRRIGAETVQRVMPKAFRSALRNALETAR